MDIQAYISTGIIESYVLGNVTEQERREVSCLSHIYPEIRQEVERLELIFEKNAELLAKNPPKEWKSEILAAAIKARQTQTKEHLQKQESKVVSLLPGYKRTLQMAAAIIMLLGAAWYIIMLRKQNAIQRETLSGVKAKMVSDSLSHASKYAGLYGITKEVLEGKSKRIEIKPTDNYPDARPMTVVWNAETGKVACISQGINLASSELDYQLWAIVDGVPTSLGVMNKESNSQEVINMAQVKGNVQAFAITLEKKGGVATPTLERMILLGKV